MMFNAVAPACTVGINSTAQSVVSFDQSLIVLGVVVLGMLVAGSRRSYNDIE